MHKQFVQPERRRFRRTSLFVILIAQAHLYFFSVRGVRHRAPLSRLIAVGPLAKGLYRHRVLSCPGHRWARLILFYRRKFIKRISSSEFIK
jgi:hypothetical protein